MSTPVAVTPMDAKGTENASGAGPTAAVRSAGLIDAENEHIAHTYHPLPVVVASAEGAWVTDVEGRRYVDCLAAYSAVNFGHGHPALVAAARAQLDRVTLTSRAFHNDQLGPFVGALAALAK
jgi:ornithine--oxo-acid transaminase